MAGQSHEKGYFSSTLRPRLRDGLRDYVFLESNEQVPEGHKPVPFFEGVSERLLRRLASNPFNLRVLRDLVYGDALSYDPQNFAAERIIRQVAAWLSQGRLRLVQPVQPQYAVLAKKEALPEKVPEFIHDQKIFVVRLETDSGLAIPEAKFEAVLSNGEKRAGTLDRKGEAILLDPPPGPVIVTYPDLEDVSAKALAVAARHGFESPDHGSIFELLQRAPATVKKAVASYDIYFNDYTGKGFVKDVGTVFTDPDARRIMDCLLARAGIAIPDPPTYVEWRQQDGA